jgi:antitoxin FitA
MTTLTIRGVDDDTRARLRVRAAQNGRSMESELRAIISAALAERPAASGLGSRIHARFAAVGGVELDLPPRADAPRAAGLEP